MVKRALSLAVLVVVLCVIFGGRASTAPPDKTLITPPIWAIHTTASHTCYVQNVGGSDVRLNIELINMGGTVLDSHIDILLTGNRGFNSLRVRSNTNVYCKFTVVAGKTEDLRAVIATYEDSTGFPISVLTAY